MAEALSAFSGAAIYLDTMVLFGYLVAESSWHASSDQFFTRAVEAEPRIALVTASLTLDELAFNLLQEAVAVPPYGVMRSRSQFLQHRPAVVRDLTQGLAPIITRVASLLDIQPVTGDDGLAMLDGMSRYGLLPRDAIHLAVMRRLGITAIASDDDAFEGIAGITLYKP
ncbi:MAG TPA: type II toxin-antitoxin system VapC family toxin [Chloroflexota bacterium]|nr:type II toxin-antitoxin system VapC family toxin [Chloroflexota bacterium]